MPLNHRPFEPRDEPALARLYLHPDIVHQMCYDPVGPEGFGQILAEFLAGAELVVVEEEGEIVGAYRVVPGTRRLSHLAHLGSVAVRPDRQGRGLGRRMMAEAIERLRVRGYRRIELTTGADNERAMRLYLSLGFRVEGTMRGYFTRAGQPGLHDEVMLAIVDEGPARTSKPAAPAEEEGA